MIVQFIDAAACGRCRQRGAGRVAWVRTVGLLLAIQQQVRVLWFRQHVINRYDTMWSGASGVVHNCDVRLHPDPASRFRQKSIVLGYHLPLVKYCEHNEGE